VSAFRKQAINNNPLNKVPASNDPPSNDKENGAAQEKVSSWVQSYPPELVHWLATSTVMIEKSSIPVPMDWEAQYPPNSDEDEKKIGSMITS
jgi:hypothetical protein